MIIETAFKMPYPDEAKPSVQVVNAFSGDVVVVLVDKVTTPAEIADAKISSVRQQRENDLANSEFDFAMTAIKDTAEIQRNTDLLQ
jgi:hypothetical protein